jgi:hypothetical protein
MKQLIKKVHDYEIYREDYACKCGCGFMAVDAFILKVHVLLAYKFGIRWVSRVCSCKAHNEHIGGHPNSFHTKGMAIDLACDLGTPQQWADCVLFYFGDWVQVKVYDNRIHVEIDYRDR